jgi:hypothetical protein
MSRDKYESTMDQLVLVAQLMEQLDLEYAMKVIDRSHAMGPFLDPTKYMNGMQNLKDAEQLVGAGLKFQATVKPLLSEVKARAKKE